jgi:ferredoxin-NADP reductase
MRLKISDLAPIKRKTSLPLLAQKKYADDQYVFEFDAQGLSWRPGEHGIFSIPGAAVKGRTWRSFSIASVPSEGVLRIATRITGNASSFKQHLKSLQPGDEITVRGPFGWFYRQDDTTPIVMVALGIGITPIIAMVRQHARDRLNAPLHVIYAAPVAHLFMDDLDAAVRQNPNIKVTYVNSSSEAKELLGAQLVQYAEGAYYYLSGAPAAVLSLRKKIRAAGVPGARIIYDPYLGY